MTTTRKQPATRFYDVPAGSSPGQCRGPNCGKTIYWVRGGFGPLPVDCDVEGGRRPSETNDTAQGDLLAPGGTADVYDGRGVSHFTTCPDVVQFSRKNL